MTPRHFLDVTDLTAMSCAEVLDLAQSPAADLGRPLDGLAAWR